jgi:hypothetical protein
MENALFNDVSAAYAEMIKATDTAAEAADYANSIENFVDDETANDAAYTAAYLKSEAKKATANYASIVAKYKGNTKLKQS